MPAPLRPMNALNRLVFQGFLLLSSLCVSPSVARHTCAVADTLRPDSLPPRPDPDQLILEPARPVLTDTSQVRNRQSRLGRPGSSSGLSRKYRPLIKILGAVVAAGLLVLAQYMLRLAFPLLAFLFMGSGGGPFAILFFFFQIIIAFAGFVALGLGIGAALWAFLIVREFVLNHKPPRSSAP